MSLSLPNNLSASLLGKLWIYTNFDCNLRCPYCLAQSGPQVSRRALELAQVKQLVDEALGLGFEHVYLTGGEPFILPDLDEMLAYASHRLPTTVLTNAVLLSGARLDKLRAIQSENLIVQVSLDGACPEHHDAYRGAGSWLKTVAAIQRLLAAGFQVRLSTTETPANAHHLEELCALHQAWGIPEAHHLIRPLARRGHSQEGREVDQRNLQPEITVTRDGAYWHPLTTDADMLVCRELFPLAHVVEQFQAQVEAVWQAEAAPAKTFV